MALGKAGRQINRTREREIIQGAQYEWGTFFVAPGHFRKEGDP